MKSPVKRRMKSPVKRRKKRKDGNDICQLGIASLIREKTSPGFVRDYLNKIVHGKENFDSKLEFDIDTDTFFTKNGINASEYCNDGADVCQRGLGVWFRNRSAQGLDCYDDLSSDAVHATTVTYDPKIDTLLKKCSRKSIEELDRMCNVHESLRSNKNNVWNTYIKKQQEQEKKEEEELRKQEQKRLKKQLKELKRLGIEPKDVELMYTERSHTRSQTRKMKLDRLSGWN